MLGRWPDVLARLFVVFAVDGRPAVFVLPVLGREDPVDGGVFGEGDGFGRTPDSDLRDCMNFRNNTPSSVASSPFAPRFVMSKVVRVGVKGCSFCGSAGTGGGRESEYFSRRPPVLSRFMSFHHFEPGDLSSSNSSPLTFADCEGRLPSFGLGLFFVGLFFRLGEGLCFPSIVVFSMLGFRVLFEGVYERDLDGV